MFGAKDVKETQGGGYIKPGIHEVTIDSVTGGYSTTGTPKLTFKLYLKDGDSSKAQDFNIFISEKSEEMAYRKIKHMCIITSKRRRVRIRTSENCIIIRSISKHV